MDTQLTVADAESQLSQYVPPGSVFLDKLNQVCEILINSGKWKGTFMALALPNVQEYITLPPRYFSVLAGKFDNFPVQTLTNWFSYMEVGPAELAETQWWTGRLLDEMDGVVTQVALAGAGGVRIYSNAIDNGKTVRLYGTRTETGEPVVDNQGVEGEEIVLNAPFVQALYHYDNLDGVQKQLTKATVQAKVVPINGDAEYQVAEWQPWETRPSYRRYFIGPAAKTVKVLCKRRFIKMISSTDWVIPGNVSALKFGLKALALEDSGYESVNESQMCWNQAYERLNQEAKSMRGGAQVPIPTLAWGFGNGIPWSN